MISKDDTKKELSKVREMIQSPAVTVVDMLKALCKLVDIAIRILLDVRLNQVRIMDALNVAKLEPIRREGKE